MPQSRTDAERDTVRPGFSASTVRQGGIAIRHQASSREEIIATTRDYIARELLQRSPGELTDSVQLIEEGYLTSLQTVDLVLYLETQFRISIEADEVSEENFSTLGTIADLVAKKLGG